MYVQSEGPSVYWLIHFASNFSTGSHGTASASTQAGPAPGPPGGYVPEKGLTPTHTEAAHGVAWDNAVPAVHYSNAAPVRPQFPGQFSATSPVGSPRPAVDAKGVVYTSTVYINGVPTDSYDAKDRASPFPETPGYFPTPMTPTGGTFEPRSPGQTNIGASPDFHDTTAGAAQQAPKGRGRANGLADGIT